MTNFEGAKVLVSAQALYALQSHGLLKNKALRGPVLTLIRQSTETSLYHTTTDFRSVAAANLLAEQNIYNRSLYHLICCNKLRHEHVVPVSFTYHKILEMEDSDIEVASLFELLCRNGLRATITRDEDCELRSKGLAKTMPAEYDEIGSSLNGNIMARYIKSGLAGSLVKRTGSSWFGL